MSMNHYYEDLEEQDHQRTNRKKAPSSPSGILEEIEKLDKLNEPNSPTLNSKCSEADIHVLEEVLDTQKLMKEWNKEGKADEFDSSVEYSLQEKNELLQTQSGLSLNERRRARRANQIQREDKENIKLLNDIQNIYSTLNSGKTYNHSHNPTLNPSPLYKEHFNESVTPRMFEKETLNRFEVMEKRKIKKITELKVELLKHENEELFPFRGSNQKTTKKKHKKFRTKHLNLAHHPQDEDPNALLNRVDDIITQKDEKLRKKRTQMIIKKQ